MGEVFSIPEKEKTLKQKALEQRRANLQKHVSDRVFKYVINLQDDSADQNQKEIAKKTREVDPKEYEYPFENLVFEGGGAKGNAYIGLLQVLDEVGILPQIKRLAGTSIGALSAMFVAAGYSTDDIKLFFGKTIPYLSRDSSVLSYIPNILKGYGVHKGVKIYKFFGERLKEKLGDPDITFKQLYKLRKIELCIVILNVTHMMEEYCHHKTTPNMPIRLAVRMSVSVPGFFQPVRHCTLGSDKECLYIDGGVLCNSPLHVYDGWFLSAKPGDDFLVRCENIDKIVTETEKRGRFEGFNEKTLGAVLFGESEHDVDKPAIEKKYGKKKRMLPDTKRAREWAKHQMEKKTMQKEYKAIREAYNTFIMLLKKHDLDNNTTITKTELENVVADDEFTIQVRKLLFGEHNSAEEILDIIDTNEDGEVDITEVMEFSQTIGVSLFRQIIGNHKYEINDLFSFASRFADTMVSNSKRIFQKERDIERLIGINTGYIDIGFEFEEKDQTFLIQCGRDSCYQFLQHYVIDNDLKKKTKLKV